MVRKIPHSGSTMESFFFQLNFSLDKNKLSYWRHLHTSKRNSSTCVDLEIVSSAVIIKLNNVSNVAESNVFQG